MKAITTGLVAALLSAGSLAAAGEIRLTRDERSEYVIYHDTAAPSSVAMAGSELQHYLFKVTGARVAILHEPRRPMICLGENAASRASGLSAENLPVEGFRIVTKDGNVYVLGPDTAGGDRTPGGGASTGTRNGTYALIERFLGVRWLVPGKHGDYVPKAASVTTSTWSCVRRAKSR